MSLQSPPFFWTKKSRWKRIGIGVFTYFTNPLFTIFLTFLLMIGSCQGLGSMFLSGAKKRGGMGSEVINSRLAPFS